MNESLNIELRKCKPQLGEALLGIAERRLTFRFGLELDVSYSLMRKNRVFTIGVGRTVNISSGGVLLILQAPIGDAEEIRLSIVWPASLKNGTPLRLFLTGQVLREDGIYLAVRILRHEFRIRAAPRGHSPTATR